MKKAAAKGKGEAAAGPKAKARAPIGKKGGDSEIKPPPIRVNLEPLLFSVVLPPPRVVAVWPHKKTSPTHLRAAQAAAGDFNQLAAIGVPMNVAIARLKVDPTLTAVDYIREALQVGNPALLFEVVRVYPFENLVSNPGFVEIIQALQTRARAGDTEAKRILKPVGEMCGASGKGQTQHYSSPQKGDEDIRTRCNRLSTYPLFVIEMRKNVNLRSPSLLLGKKRVCSGAEQDG